MRNHFFTRRGNELVKLESIVVPRPIARCRRQGVRRAMQGIVATFLLLVYSPIAYSQESDLITPVEGPPVRGLISNTTSAELTIMVRGNEKKIGANKIKKLRLGGEPSGLNNARDDIADQKYAEALGKLNKIDAGGIERALIRQELQYLIAFCKAELALGTGQDVRGAAKAMSDFVKQGKNSIHYYDAVQRLGDLAMTSGNPSFAARVFSQMAMAPWPEYRMRAMIREAQALAAQNSFDEAIQKYDEVLQLSTNNPQTLKQKTLAQVGKAGLEGTLGKTQQSITVLEDVIAKNDPQESELFARTYNALGNCHLKAGNVQDAILAFLHTHLMFYQIADAHAEALYQLGNLWDKIGRSDRATEARNLLKSRYAGSPWAQK